MKDNNTKYILIAILAICFLATGGIFVKISVYPPITTAFYRVLFSLPILYPFIKIKKQKIEKREYLWMFLAGIFLAFDLIFWNISFHKTTVANANLLANMVPFTIIPFSYFVLKKKFKKIFYCALFTVLCGVLILMLGKISPNSNNYFGDFLAFITSIFYAMFLLTVSKIRGKFDAMTIMFYSAYGSLVVLFVAMYSFERLVFPKVLVEFYPLLGLALFSQILGQGILSYVVGKIDVSLSSIIVLSQPVVAAVYSFLIFAEVLTFQEIIGVFIVLLGIFLAKRSFNE